MTIRPWTRPQSPALTLPRPTRRNGRRAAAAPKPRQQGDAGGSLLFSEVPTRIEGLVERRFRIGGIAALLMASGIGLLAWTYALRLHQGLEYPLF